MPTFSVADRIPCVHIGSYMGSALANCGPISLYMMPMGFKTGLSRCLPPVNIVVLVKQKSMELVCSHLIVMSHLCFDDGSCLGCHLQLPPTSL